MTALRLFRAVFATAALLGVMLTATTWWRAMADLPMQTEQQWPYRCGLLVGATIVFVVITAVLALSWFVAQREYRMLKALPPPTDAQ
jgi:hypothetical protein